jgi:hypothetical protein
MNGSLFPEQDKEAPWLEEIGRAAILLYELASMQIGLEASDAIFHSTLLSFR